MDAAFRAYMRGELKRIQREVGQTMIYVTHDQVEAMSMADNIAVMDFGVLQQFGTPDEIYNQPVNTFVANFIGSPSMNFIDCGYQVEDGQGYLMQLHGTARIAVDEKRRQLLEKRSDNEHLILGIRPEHMTIHPETDRPDLLQATTHFIEPLGPKTVIHLQLGDTDIIRVIAPPYYRATLEEPQWVEIHHRYVHIFDAQTGEVIR